ncbi:F0F1 ATP synthase subunit A [Mollicutes bacterium LVI A0039]|nr:F0F1 ATP synthase subunit A [Mollicutes bacterium LVI A0039]
MNIEIRLFGTTLSSGFTTFIIAIAIVAFIMMWATKTMKTEHNYRITSLSTAIIDMLFMFIYNLVEGIVGEELVEEFMPLGMSLFFTLLLANTLSLIGLQEAVTDLVVPIVLVLTLFIAWTLYALKKIGLVGYIKGIFGDAPALFPLELLGRLTSPLSMSLRIFGNILSGFVIMNLIWIIMGAVFASGLAAIASANIIVGVATLVGGLLISVASIGLVGYFSVFSPVIQALVFTSLALSNFKSLVEE